MIEYYKTVNGQLKQTDRIEDHTWVVMIHPNEQEKIMVMEQLDIEPSFFQDALDEEEASHIEIEDNQTAIIVDIPYKSEDDEFYTIPLGLILAKKNLVTICTKETPVLRSLTSGLTKNIDTTLRIRLIFQIFYRISQVYLVYLKQLNKLANQTEQELHQSSKNKELIRMLDIEKSLVFFSTSLKSCEATLQKILRGRLLTLYEEDKDLLEDVLIELHQAIEMCTIYRDILSGTMDAFASIISNNLNIVMRILTSITILMAIPNMVTSFYGMNVELPFVGSPLFAILVSIVAVTIVAIILKKKNLL